MSIRCGNHEAKTYHPTIDDVRACFAGATAATPRYEEVFLTDGQLSKIVDGIKDMEREGILPRSGRPVTEATVLADLTRGTTAIDRQAPEFGLASNEGVVEALTRAAGSVRTATVRTSPKGNTIPEEFGGSPAQYDYMLSMVTELGEADTYDWSLIKSVRHASVTIDSLKDKVRDARRLARSSKQRNDYGAVYSDGAVEDAPVRQRVTGQVTEDGIYRNPETGEIFKVQVAVHGSGHLYAKQAYLDGLTPEYSIPLSGDPETAGRVEWAYRPGLLSKIKPEWKATMEVAKAFGALYGRCIRCHRTLTREDSIERAMGPICASKF